MLALMDDFWGSDVVTPPPPFRLELFFGPKGPRPFPPAAALLLLLVLVAPPPRRCIHDPRSGVVAGNVDEPSVVRTRKDDDPKVVFLVGVVARAAVSATQIPKRTLESHRNDHPLGCLM